MVQIVHSMLRLYTCRLCGNSRGARKLAEIPEMRQTRVVRQAAQVCTFLGFELISDRAPRRKRMLRQDLSWDEDVHMV